MKLAFGLLQLSAASHFRAGGLQYRTTSDPTKYEVTRYMGWKRSSSGYSGGCDQSDIDNKVSSDSRGDETITGVGKVPAKYIVTDIEDSALVSSDSHFCFGSYTFEIDVSSVTSFEHSFNGCCTISFQLDDGSSTSGNFGYKATVNDVTNSSPQFASPPVVYLMKGCGGQEYAVAPVDPEGDTVRCRWSSSSESYAMAWSSMLTQFSLDQDTCVVTYHPENDQATTGGSKAISVQVEDFDADGNLLHSVPLVFIALVSEPQLPNARSSSLFKEPLYTGLMGGNDDHHDLPSALSRNRRSQEPAYCAGRPSFIMPPSEVETIVVEYAAGESVDIDWVAEYQLDGNSFTDIDRYQFVKPDGMTCSAFDASGVSQCTWIPEESQIGEHPHCATVYDPYGRSSERRCILIQLFEACDKGLERVGKYCLPPCSTGYERDESINCVDIDECSVAFGPCSPIIETCANNNGGFTCECSPGYERDATGTCADVDECAIKTDNCANTVEECVNSVGSFDCPCASGFERNIEGRCLDINECVKETDTCVGFTETCENTFGSFKCPKSAAFRMILMQQAMLAQLGGM